MIEELEARYNYIEGVWLDLYGTIPLQSTSIDAMREKLEALRDTNTEKYLDVLEELVKYMEECPTYKQEK
tara:strand:- start:39 stop:248 length:210 start_codon:yes stop_codon:yes gene_type:complete